MSWSIANQTLTQRLWLGSAQYPSPAVLLQALQNADIEVVTVSLRRHMAGTPGAHESFFSLIQQSGCRVLPNTASCKSAKEAILTAQMGREIWQTDWVKLEVIGDDWTLQPDPFELLEAAKVLAKDGFQVLPYCTEDLVLCQRLLEAGCPALMPWAAPIGSNQGLLNPQALLTLRERLLDVPLIVDAGIGKPSQACQAMEMGFDAVLLNTAVALSADPVKMARGFADAVRAGRGAYEAGMVPSRSMAKASTPVLDDPLWRTVSHEN
jgi:thiazole synthase